MSSFSTSGSANNTTNIVTQGTVKNLFSEALAVATNATADILTYTVPVGVSTYLLRIEMSGTNIATYDVLLNGDGLARKRTYFGGDYCQLVEFGENSLGALQINSGDVLIVRVTNFRPSSGSFEARMQYAET